MMDTESETDPIRSRSHGPVAVRTDDDNSAPFLGPFDDSALR